MDLFERGRSLSELGKTMRWTDLTAFLLHAPPTSYYRRAVDPEGARREEYQDMLTQPSTKFLGDIYDQVEALRTGVLDPHGIVVRTLAKLYDIELHELAELTASNQGEGGAEGAAPAPVKRAKTAAEIRAQVARAYEKYN